VGRRRLLLKKCLASRIFVCSENQCSSCGRKAGHNTSVMPFSVSIKCMYLAAAADRDMKFVDLGLFCRSRWARGLRRGSAAVQLLGLRVRILPGAWMFVSCE
jgi:hypothetical protein